MVKEKQIAFEYDNFAITEDVTELERVDRSVFPVLIFQEFLKQLKVPTVPFFVTESGQLYQSYPALLEQLDDVSFYKAQLKYVINKNDLINYYIACYILKSKFNTQHIFIENGSKITLNFVPVMPFASTDEMALPELMTVVMKGFKPKELTQIVERFFILLGGQFADKLLTFLTFLESKYKFKLDKKAFIASVLDPDKLAAAQQHILQKFNL